MTTTPPDSPFAGGRAERFKSALPVVIGLAVFLLALILLRTELRAVTWHELTGAVLQTPLRQLVLALVLTAISYAVLTGYDLLAFKYIGKRLPARRIAGVAFLAYAISHNVGFAALSGASVRYRFYSRWGVSAEDLSRIVFSYSVTFWLGLLALGGVSFIASPLPAADGLPGHQLLIGVGWLLVFVVIGYVVATMVRREPLRVWGWTFPLPSTAMALQQLGVSVVDWVLAGLVLFLLLPPDGPPFLAYQGAFLVAVLLGMVSHVPGGVGVFEGMMVLLLKPWLTAAELLPVFVVYRVVYYLAPLVVALLVLVGVEVHQRRIHVAAAGSWLGRATERATPRVLSAFTFLSGIVLLVSGATPASPGRLDQLDRVLPLGIIETSHFIGSVAGAGLLIVSQGLARRLDAAYYLATLLIVVGMAASLLKGFDIEEAALLFAVLLVLYRARPAFDRRAALFETRFSAGWIAAVTGAIGASVSLGLFAFKHVDYAAQLWWRFELSGEASRFLRGSVGAAVGVLLVALARLIRQPPHDVTAPGNDDLNRAAGIITAQTATSGNLVFLRDKGLLFNDERDAFLMYGVQARTWVAMGDPVGPEPAMSELIRRFLERADDFGAAPVFYEVGARHLHRYVDFGLALVKLGEEARVNLAAFSLDGGQGAGFRQSVRRLERDGGTFRVVPPAGIAAILPQLRSVSDDWLHQKGAAEKRFSLGFFDDAYVSRYPVGVIERGGVILAFANLWPGGSKVELSMDLMRFSGQAPKGVMEALLVHLMLWGKAQGYQYFILGMAPLSGFEDSPVASLWQRVGAFVYEHGEAMYGFHGLRAFKDKFHPEWEPRYLAYQGGLGLPRILADTSALIAGGYRQIFMK
jgi:phosphatidylglycerol lysyltransferase